MSSCLVSFIRKGEYNLMYFTFFVRLGLSDIVFKFIDERTIKTTLKEQKYEKILSITMIYLPQGGY
ncbi:hypothetical protein MASR2M18_20930 [Ignavibacteria bacterium]